MRMLSLSIGALAVGSLLLVACVGDTATPGTGTQGDLDGPCFSNGTCNSGLVCDVIKGTAKCVAGGDAAAGDASPGGDSGLPVCSFQQTSFPCTGGGPTAAACYGDTQTCATTGCFGQNDQRWSCFSPNQCSTLACCLSASDATLSAGKSCAQGALSMVPGTLNGATCGTGTTCGAGDTQLCQFNSQCPAGQICTAVKVISLGDGGAVSLDGVVLGACAPP